MRRRVKHFMLERGSGTSHRSASVRQLASPFAPWPPRKTTAVATCAPTSFAAADTRPNLALVLASDRHRAQASQQSSCERGAAERKGGWTILNRCSPDSRLGPHFKGPARFRPILPRSPRAETRLKGTLALRTAAAPRSHRRRPRPPPRRPTKQAAVQSRHAPTARSG